MKTLLQTGKLYWTRGIEEAMSNVMMRFFVLGALECHKRGNWGDIDDQDKEENDRALENELRVVSSYNTDMVADGKIWIITERGRETTTVLLPSEY